jgi:two-component system phosphate regulon sensor histidine kinase PhoR
MKKRLVWQLFLSYLLIIFISLLISTIYSSKALRQFCIEQTETDLKIKAYLVEKQISGHFLAKHFESTNQLCKELGQKALMRITVVLPSGKVVGDSEEASTLMDNHKNRPEIKEALEGKVGNSIRYSHTLQKEMMYTAVPLIKDYKIVGIVRTAIPLLFVEKMLKVIYLKIIIEGLVIAIIAIILSFFMSRRISRPLEELELGAKEFAKGNLKCRLPISNTKEIGELANAMNDMAIQLDAKLSQIIQQSHEQEIILENMAESVIAVDIDGQIIKLNKAAADLIGTNLSEVEGLKIHEVIENVHLHEFVAKALSSKTPVKEDIILASKGNECFLQTYSTALQDSEGQNIGALIVLNDITQIKKLENIRRDFIANVSHELKTPITSIKGYAETLLDGAMFDPDDTKHFLKIILKQSNRLNNIIEDLLNLARLEQDPEKNELVMEKIAVQDILKSVIQICAINAEAKDIKLNFSCSDDIKVIANPFLLEQALVNLVDNAIKYSSAQSIVSIEGFQSKDETLLRVSDKGYGISKEHLPRIFERFYRVDKARSRKLGGTGLGLSIVKHISQIHGGYTTVESQLGEGSTFSIHLPLTQAEIIQNKY